MNIDALRYMLIINQVKSINKAAQKLYVTQPTLSRLVQGIEEDIGLSIFVRTNKGVETTYEGQKFLERVQTLIDDFDELKEDYFNYKHAPADETTLYVGSHFSSPSVDALIQFFNKQNNKDGNINIIFLENTVDQIMDDIFKGVLDIGVVHFMSDKEDLFRRKCESMDLIYNVINESNVYAQVSSEHPLTKYKSVTQEMLMDYPHITFLDEDLTGINHCSDRNQYDRSKQSKRIVVNDRGTLRTLIQNTHGYYLGNFASCAPNIKQNMAYIPISDYSPKIKTVSMYPQNKRLSLEEKSFLKILQEIYS